MEKKNVTNWIDQEGRNRKESSQVTYVTRLLTRGEQTRM